MKSIRVFALFAALLAIIVILFFPNKEGAPLLETQPGTTTTTTVTEVKNEPDDIKQEQTVRTETEKVYVPVYLPPIVEEEKKPEPTPEKEKPLLPSLLEKIL